MALIVVNSYKLTSVLIHEPTRLLWRTNMTTFRAPVTQHELLRLEWFGGNTDAHQMAVTLTRLANVWDDLIDKDEVVTDKQINDAFATCLVYLPANPFYRAIQSDVLPLWVTVISAYETSNLFEKNKDEHGLEIAHTLRYAAGHILAYAIHVCVGPDAAREHIPAMWKMVVNERMDEYRMEHTLKEQYDEYQQA